MFPMFRFRNILTDDDKNKLRYYDEWKKLSLDLNDALIKLDEKYTLLKEENKLLKEQIKILNDKNLK